MLARGAAVTVLYQCGEREKKNPERNKDRFCGQRSCCGNRPVIGRPRAPRAYKSRCEWLKGLAQQLEPRVCVPALLLSILPFALAVRGIVCGGTRVQVTWGICCFYVAALYFFAKATPYFLLRGSEGVEVTSLSCLLSPHIFPLSLNQDLACPFLFAAPSFRLFHVHLVKICTPLLIKRLLDAPD